MKNWRSFFRRIRNVNTTALFAGSGILLLAAALAALCFGAAGYTPAELLKNLDILRYIRLPRVLAAMFAGAGLAGCGVILQTLLGNSLAGPNIIGVNSGAGFMTLIAGVILPRLPLLQPPAAFLGAMLAMLMVLLPAKRANASQMTILLTGVILNSLFNAASEAICTFFPDAGMGYGAFRVGGFSTVQMPVLYPAMLLIALAAIIALWKADVLEMLALGEETAFSLGISVGKYRAVFLMCAACMAGAAVSFAGLIGFLGLIVPHAARLVCGEEIRKLLPLSMLWGALLLLVCDTLARTVFAPFELPVGIVISVIGAPVFIRMLLRRKAR